MKTPNYHEKLEKDRSAGIFREDQLDIMKRLAFIQNADYEKIKKLVKEGFSID